MFNSSRDLKASLCIQMPPELTAFIIETQMRFRYGFEKTERKLIHLTAKGEVIFVGRR